MNMVKVITVLAENYNRLSAKDKKDMRMILKDVWIIL